MASGTCFVTFSCFLSVLFCHLVGFCANAHPSPVTAPSAYCAFNSHPNVSDLVGTTYLDHVHSVKLPSSGRVYRYAYYAPSPQANRPTILFLHGFPSSSFDWRRQFTYFALKGYGVLAPDLLGYGGTDKPSDPAAYAMKSMAADVVDLLDCISGAGKAVIVAHDLIVLVNMDSGSVLQSRVWTYYPTRFEKYVFLDIGYFAPGLFLGEAGVIANKDTLGYQIFFNEDRSGSVLDQHQDSIWSLLYTSNVPKYWPKYLSPPGAVEAFLNRNGRVPTGSFVSIQDELVHNRIFAVTNGGYNPSLNWYRSMYRNVNLADENTIPKSAANITKPVLLVTAANDTVGTPAAAEAQTRPYAPDLNEHQVDSGHFVMLERADEVNKAMSDFFEK
ncbi:uncharacterized protein KY384_007077 [Bacidia gigantensis]|uniref:uncharacterized protein n=1 Tax=Bacidia gigantensis TaxID=2732470 RepID=UPI001D059741|nr:uncharacterized protein KY384_007077 [Bacidia gigantensis]KAG8528160.1 hypothetical protein KY384_007077 [Bacidia gigantensis]